MYAVGNQERFTVSLSGGNSLVLHARSTYSNTVATGIHMRHTWFAGNDTDFHYLYVVSDEGLEGISDLCPIDAPHSSFTISSNEPRMEEPPPDEP